MKNIHPCPAVKCSKFDIRLKKIKPSEYPPSSVPPLLHMLMAAETSESDGEEETGAQVIQDQAGFIIRKYLILNHKKSGNQ